MSNNPNPYELLETMNAMLSGRSLIVASEDNLEPLRADGALRGSESTALVALPPDVVLPADMLGDVRVLVLEVDPANEASLHRLATLHVDHPDIAIIVALRDASVALVRTLIRQGVTDVTQLPFSSDSLAAQILDALSGQTEKLQSTNLSPLVAVVGATGGSGSTSVLTHLAAAIAKRNTGNRGVCLIDLDLQAGDAAAYIGASPKVTVDALLEAGARLDAELLRSSVTETDYGFSVIAAPEAIKPMDRIDIDQVLATLRLARSMFDHVLVEVPPCWNNWSLSTVKSADRVVLVCDTSIGGLRQAKRRLQLFSEIDVPRSRIQLVLNKMERKLFRSVNSNDVEGTLNVPVTAVLATEQPALRDAQDAGRLVTDAHPKSRFAADVGNLADALMTPVREI